MIPIYSTADNRLLRYAPAEFLTEHQAHFRLVRNRRGHLKRAYCKPAQSLDTRPASTLGLAFHQMLPSGPVWALRGTTGSER